jgi:hypothetical protein
MKPTHVGVGLDGAVRERRIAGAEDAVGPALDAELGLEGRLDVERSGHGGAEAVHWKSPPGLMG